MIEIRHLKLDEQTRGIREDFQKLEKALKENESIADPVNLLYGKIHSLKSNLFLVDRNRSLKITYLMENYMNRLRKGKAVLSGGTVELLLECMDWIHEDLLNQIEKPDHFNKLLDLLKALDGGKSSSTQIRWNLSADEKALLRDGRNSGLNIFSLEYDSSRNGKIIEKIKETGMLVHQSPFLDDKGTESFKTIFISDKKLREFHDRELELAVPFDEDLYLSFGDHKILILEDNPVAQLLQKSIMKEFGVCDTVKDGESGLDLFRLAHEENFPYSIVLLDLVMPGKSGEEVLKIIRDEEAARNVKGLDRCKVIVSTTTSDSSVLMDLFRAEADAYIVKPLTREKIVRELKNLKLI